LRAGAAISGSAGEAGLVMALAWAWWVVLVAQILVGLAFFMFHGVLQARATEALPEALPRRGAPSLPTS
jgi:hypothetical protein